MLQTVSTGVAASDTQADVTDLMKNFRLAFERLFPCEIAFPKKQRVYVDNRTEIQELSITPCPVFRSQFSSYLA